jgi:hypothetical protein
LITKIKHLIMENKKDLRSAAEIEKTKKKINL